MMRIMETQTGIGALTEVASAPGGIPVSGNASVGKLN